ncbi:MAG TPA: twitch domain-containing radical SAM protein [Gaiellaceae bacterium]|nr:twitch domain-containing radical SAM protein [Gaiellaceae bacterium]
MSETFCPLPWTHLIVRGDGGAQTCNWSSDRIRDDGVDMNVGRSSLESIWNSRHMRDIRRAMVAGRRVSACQACYATEELGGQSMRQQMLQRWQNGFLNEERATVETLKAEAARHDFNVARRPRFLQLDVGNLCNLRCRMCSSGASSAINRDPVHRRWSEVALDLVHKEDAWFRLPIVRRGLIEDATELRQLHVIGGEPLAIREVGELLRLVVESGRARDVEVSFHTNATITRPSWLELLSEFGAVVVYVSVDGTERLYDYIRFPARWHSFVRNLDILRDRLRAELRGHVVVQIYNALDVVSIFRFLDARQVPIHPHLLWEPAFLRPTLLPRSARVLAARRLRTYAREECRPNAKELVLGVATMLERAEDENPELLHEFMVFTNDLDHVRGQRFAEVDAELMEHLGTAGVTWTSEIRHASNRPAPARSR